MLVFLTPKCNRFRQCRGAQIGAADKNLTPERNEARRAMDRRGVNPRAEPHSIVRKLMQQRVTVKQVTGTRTAGGMAS
jgi:hypothetical protein